MLDNHYKLYSQNRMKMLISVLKNYNIQVTNSDIIDLLITEAKTAQIQCDYLLPLKKPFKALGAIIIPIVIYAAQKIADATTVNELLTISLQIIFIIMGTSKNTSRASRASNLSLIYSLFLVNFCL